MIESEVWKPIKNYEEYYQISNLGNVKSLYKIPNIILKQHIRSEYFGVCLCKKNSKQKTFNVHSLVANAFLQKPSDDVLIINHKNGIKTQNNVENLEWISVKENNKHARETKLNIPKTIRVSQYTRENVLVQIFDSIKEAMDKTGFKDTKICLVCKGKRNHTGGYIWKYTDFEYNEDKEPDGQFLNDYPNYIITNDGKVYSKSYKKYLSTRENSGYQYVTLYNNSKKGKDFSIHYLVGINYIPNPYNYPMLNHKNHNRNDNRIENLEWVTYSDNMKHFGKKNGKAVNKLDNYGKIIKSYNTIKDASDDNNISTSGITNVCKGNQKTTGGFKWEYKIDKELASPL